MKLEVRRCQPVVYEDFHKDILMVFLGTVLMAVCAISGSELASKAAVVGMASGWLLMALMPTNRVPHVKEEPRRVWTIVGVCAVALLSSVVAVAAFVLS